MKLTKEQIKEIKGSKEPYKVLARKYNVTPNTIRFHKSEDFKKKLREYQRNRYKNLSEQNKKKLQDKRKEYMKDYHRNRYKNDEEFRTKQIERVLRGRKNESRNRIKQED